MSDLNQTVPLFVSTLSRYATAVGLRAAAGAQGSGNLTWVANDVVYAPVSIPWPYPVSRVFWANGSTLTSSHADFGIYTPSGTKIYSTGSTVMSGTQAPQYTTPTSFLLDPGDYYFAFWCDNTTSRAYGLTTVGTAAGALCGFQTQAGQSACPATATFAAFSTNLVPLCGVTRTPSGF